MWFVLEAQGIATNILIAWKQQPGSNSRDATAGRQAGPFPEPGAACRSVAAGDAVEATEKLYERHYLVIKIVSSFFACLIKFLYL